MNFVPTMPERQKKLNLTPRPNSSNCTNSTGTKLSQFEIPFTCENTLHFRGPLRNHRRNLQYALAPAGQRKISRFFVNRPLACAPFLLRDRAGKLAGHIETSMEKNRFFCGAGKASLSPGAWPRRPTAPGARSFQLFGHTYSKFSDHRNVPGAGSPI